MNILVNVVPWLLGSDPSQGCIKYVVLGGGFCGMHVPLLVSTVFCQDGVSLPWPVIHHNRVHTSQSLPHPPHYCKHCRHTEKEIEFKK